MSMLIFFIDPQATNNICSTDLQMKNAQQVATKNTCPAFYYFAATTLSQKTEKGT